MGFSTLMVTAAMALGASAQEFLFTGTNEAGAEFGEANLPGKLDTDYTWPDLDAIDTLAATGMNTFRINTKMERLIPDDLYGEVNETYFEGLQTVVDHVTGAGNYAIIDPHNYGRYYSSIMTDVAGFAAWWTTIATRFADNDLVIFDTNNEYHTMENSLVAELNQAAIDAIRAAGATSQYIFVEGNAWSGAWSWVSSGNGDSLVGLTDPVEGKLIYEMHQYLDSDSSGTNEACVSGTIGSERLAEATEWLRAEGKLGVLGEFAGSGTDTCRAAVGDMMEFLLANADVWTGWLWWAAGPWWADYMYSLEPPSGPAYVQLFDVIEPYIGA